jgi:hypothetical protein
VLTIILRPKREKITECWEKNNGEKIHNLCLSPNNIGMDRSRRMRVRYEMHRKVWLENLKRKSSSGRPRRKWENNNKTYNL